MPALGEEWASSQNLENPLKIMILQRLSLLNYKILNHGPLNSTPKSIVLWVRIVLARPMSLMQCTIFLWKKLFQPYHASKHQTWG